MLQVAKKGKNFHNFLSSAKTQMKRKIFSTKERRLYCRMNLEDFDSGKNFLGKESSLSEISSF